MTILMVSALQIVLTSLAIILLYVIAISILYRSKASLILYLVLLLLPIVGALGIILGSITISKKKKIAP